MRAVYTRTPSGGVGGDSTDVRQPLLPTARPAAFDVGDSAGGRPRGGGKRHAGVLTWLTLAILALVLVSFIDVQVRSRAVGSHEWGKRDTPWLVSLPLLRTHTLLRARASECVTRELRTSQWGRCVTCCSDRLFDPQVRKAHSSSAKSSSRIQDDATSEFSETAPARSTTPKAPKVKATTTTVAAPSASPKGSTSDMLYPTEAMPAPTAAAASPTAVTAAVVPQYVPLVSTTVPSATTVAAPAMAQTVLVTLPPPPPVAVPAATVLATPVLAPSSPPPAVAVPLPATLVAAATAASLPVATPLPPPPPPPAAASVGSLLRSAFPSVLGGAASSPPPLVEGAPSSVRTKAIMTTAASGTLPKGFPNAPPGLPLLQWVDKYYYTQLGAPAPADLPPGPPNLSREQWAAQWTWEQQQAEEQAAQQAAQQGARGTVAGAAAPAPGTGPGESSLTMRSLASYDALAVCNDGSPGAFYYAPGSDPTTWLVFLQGGMWCWDAESCSERAQNGPAQVSSASWPAVMTQVGIFDSEASLNPFATANKVYIGYCSSDGTRLYSVPASCALHLSSAFPTSDTMLVPQLGWVMKARRRRRRSMVSAGLLEGVAFCELPSMCSSPTSASAVLARPLPSRTGSSWLDAALAQEGRCST